MELLLLFLTGFIAATLFPASSEALLLTLQAQGHVSLALFVAATLGNTLGSCVNWYLGLRLLDFQHKRWFPFSAQSISRAQRHFQRYGIYSLLLAWLPVVGDPLTLIAGVLKVPFRQFFLLVLLGKALRYGVLIWFGQQLLAE